MDEIRFVYKKEFWYVSAFVNTHNLNIHQKAKALGALLLTFIHGLTADHFRRLSHDSGLLARAVEMAHSLSLECSWNTLVEGFPYHEENTALTYHRLGYFEFEVEYFKDHPEKKAAIEPLLLQQIPVLVLGYLQRFCKYKINNALYLDTESPIYIFVTSEEVAPDSLLFTPENIDRHKRAIGSWTEIYSGAWPDYSDSLYARRVEPNLSNRLSELHFIRRNSGFVYMAKENYQRFFDSYMRRRVLRPTAQLRAMLFALISINESLDILLLRQSEEVLPDVSLIEKKLRNLRHLRAALQMEMSKLYNELDYNRRQHYASVIAHLLREFNLEPTGIFARINEKFELIYDSMHRLYQKKESENQEKTERGMRMLNMLFSLGILADFTSLLLGAVSGFRSGDTFAGVVSSVFSSFIIGVFLVSIWLRIKSRLDEEKEKIVESADAIVLDGKDNVLVILRAMPPFKGQYAFPGNFVEDNEPPEKTALRAVKEETNLDVVIERKLGVYDSPGRDPRGRIISHVFVCRPASETYELRGREDAMLAQFIPIAELRGTDLAFDHEDMLEHAVPATA